MDQSRNNEHLQAIIVRMFQSYSCKQNTLLSKSRLSQILNHQSNIFNTHNISQYFIEQIWGQAQTLSKGESTVIILSKIIAEAISILKQRIQRLNDPVKGIPHLKKELQLRSREITTFEDSIEGKQQPNNDKMNTALKNKNIIEGKLQELETNKANFEKEYNQLQCCLKIREPTTRMEETTFIHNQYSLLSSTSENPSPYLKTIFTVTLFTLFLQLFIMNVRPNFLALLLQVLTLFWLFYGYYDQHYVKILLAGVAINCVFDISYVCLFSLQKIGTNLPSSSIFISLVGIALLVIDVAIRIYLMTVLCRYIYPPDKCQFFQLFSRKIYLALRSGKQMNV